VNHVGDGFSIQRIESCVTPGVCQGLEGHAANGRMLDAEFDYVADLVVIDEEVNVYMTMVRGQEVYRAGGTIQTPATQK